MNTHRSMWGFLSLLLSCIGICILVAAVRTPSDLADAGVLIGAILIALAVFPLFMAGQEHSRLKALRHHMRHASHATRTTQKSRSRLAASSR